MALIGNFFPEPSEEGAVATVDPTTADELPDERTDEEVISSGVGMVASSWVLPSPFDPVELKELADGLKLRRQRLEVVEAELDAREGRVGEREESATARFEALDDLRGQLDEFEQELLMRELEVVSDETASRERAAEKWGKLGKLIEGLDEERRKDFLLGYEPSDVAQILRTLDVDSAAKLLQAISDGVTDPLRLREYLDAYAAVSGD